MVDWVHNLVAGGRYVCSSTYREKKRAEWAGKSATYRVGEVGLWSVMALVTAVVAIVVLVLELAP